MHLFILDFNVIDLLRIGGDLSSDLVRNCQHGVCCDRGGGHRRASLARARASRASATNSGPLSDRRPIGLH